MIEQLISKCVVFSRCCRSYRVYCVLGDGEMAEGSVWEAVSFAGHYKLDNLCIIADINRLGQSEATALGHDMETYRDRFTAFGCVSPLPWC